MQVTDEMVEAARSVPRSAFANSTLWWRAALTAALAKAWRPISEAPHGQLVLLGWRDWRDGTWCMDVGCASHGHRTEAGSSVSYHGSATDWMPLPAPPAKEAGHVVIYQCHVTLFIHGLSVKIRESVTSEDLPHARPYHQPPPMAPEP